MFKGTFKSQLLLIAIAPLLVVILLVSVFLLKDSLQFINDDLDIRAKEITNHVVSESEFYFYTGDIEKLTEVADDLLTRDDLNSIRFMARDKEEWVYRTKDAKEYETKMYLLPVSSEVEVNDFVPINTKPNTDNVLGYIEVGLSQAGLYSKRKAVYTRVILIALLAMICGIGFSYLVGLKLSCALDDLVKTASKIEQNNLESRCQETGDGELLQFQKAFNNMAQSLQRNEQELQAEINTTIQTLNQTIEELALRETDLDNTREKTLELVRGKAVADERSRIMRDIHDGIGGQLMASLSLIEKEKDSSIRKNIHSILSDCLDDFRLIINSLNVNANTLSALLADYKFSLSKKIDNLDIAIDWTMDEFADSVVLPPHYGLHLLRILQEAFTNILKHSGATEIYFHTYMQNNNAVIIIEDNGKFRLRETDRTGQGLLNMQSRAQELGGGIEIGQSEAGGCRVLLTIPLPSSA